MHLCGHKNSLTSGFRKYISFSPQQMQREARELLPFMYEFYVTMTRMKEQQSLAKLK